MRPAIRADTAATWGGGSDEQDVEGERALDRRLRAVSRVPHGTERGRAPRRDRGVTRAWRRAAVLRGVPHERGVRRGHLRELGERVPPDGGLRRPDGPPQAERIVGVEEAGRQGEGRRRDRKSTRLNSSHGYISYA